jgi:dihydrofolate synthase/folylpolyglutamate synthase
VSRFDAALTRLHTLYPKLIDLRLERLERLLGELGHPERKLPPVLHVAGTNGKGSVCAFAAAIAEAAGLKVHVYSSPHLVRFNERFRLNGELATDDQIAEALDAVEAANGPAQITVFEAITAAAFYMFAKYPADLAIIEVGLGGRLDATNVVSPKACAITSVSLDHQDFLGATLAAIAAEKAGIIKDNVPVVTGFQPPEVMAVIEAEAAAHHAPLWRRGQDWAVRGYGYGIVYDKMALPRPSLLGPHQVENAGIAISLLRAAGYKFNDRILAKGLTSAQWPARMQRLHGALAKALPEGAQLWLDGAHNPGGALALAEQLQAFSGPTTLIVGMKQSKDVGEVLRILAPHAAEIYAVAEPGQHLALPVEAIIEASQGKAKPGPDIAGALKQITAPTRVLICGSLYLAGEVLKLDGAGAGK